MTDDDSPLVPIGIDFDEHPEKIPPKREKRETSREHANRTGKGITSPALIRTAERRAFTLELREKGFKYEVIAKAVIGKFGIENLPSGYDRRYAAGDVMRELDHIRKEMRENSEHLIDMQYRRLESLYNAHIQLALGGSHRSTEICLRIMERISKLFGLDAPIQVKMDFRATLISQVVAGQITLQDLQRELGEEYVTDILRGVDQSLLTGPRPSVSEDDPNIIDTEFIEVPDEEILDEEI